MHTLRALTMAAAATIPAAAQNCTEFFFTASGATKFQIANDGVRTFTLPFAFPFNGTTLTQVTYCSNGFLWLGAPPAVNQADPSDSTAEMLSEPARIAACWDDWDTEAPTIPLDGGAFVFMRPTQVSFLWKGIPRAGTTTNLANMECVLASTGEITIRFEASMSTPNNSSIVGISKGGGATPSLVDWTPRPATISDSTGYQSFTNLAGGSPFNLAGHTINFAPASPPSGAPPIHYTVHSTALPLCSAGFVYPLPALEGGEVGISCPMPPDGMFHQTSLAAIGQLFLMISSVPTPNFGVGLWAVGTSNPNLPVDAIFGPGTAPGCTIYSDGTIDIDLFSTFTPGGTLMSKTFLVPPNTAFLGITVFTQAASYSTLNAAGVITSNGRTQTVGL